MVCNHTLTPVAILVAIEPQWCMPLIPALERTIKQEEAALNTQSHSEIPGGRLALSRDADI